MVVDRPPSSLHHNKPLWRTIDSAQRHEVIQMKFLNLISDIFRLFRVYVKSIFSRLVFLTLYIVWVTLAIEICIISSEGTEKTWILNIRTNIGHRTEADTKTHFYPCTHLVSQFHWLKISSVSQITSIQLVLFVHYQKWNPLRSLWHCTLGNPQQWQCSSTCPNLVNHRQAIAETTLKMTSLFQ